MAQMKKRGGGARNGGLVDGGRDGGWCRMRMKMYRLRRGEDARVGLWVCGWGWNRSIMEIYATIIKQVRKANPCGIPRDYANV